jgi:hypothetical protein
MIIGEWGVPVTSACPLSGSGAATDNRRSFSANLVTEAILPIIKINTRHTVIQKTPSCLHMNTFSYAAMDDVKVCSCKSS